MKTFFRPWALVAALLLTSQTFGQDQADRHSFDGLIINENAVLGLCGEFPYERDPRDCLDPSTDLKLCLHLNKVDPRFKRTTDESLHYSCINSSSSGGAELIREVLEESETQDGCLARNVRSFYEELIQSEDFRELSREFENQLGMPLVLNFAIDTRDSVASLQLDLKDSRRRPDQENGKSEAVNLLLAPFAKEQVCRPINRDAVLGKVTQELTRLAMIQGRKKYNPLGEDDFHRQGQQVIDSGRYNYQKDSEEPSENESGAVYESASVR